MRIVLSLFLAIGLSLGFAASSQAAGKADLVNSIAGSFDGF